MAFLQGLFGPPNIKKMQASRDIKGLEKALGYQKDGKVRKEAAMALGEIKSISSVDMLAAACQDHDDLVVWSAIRALGCIGDERAVEALILLLKAPSSYTRREAILALGAAGTPKIVELIDTIFNDEDSRVYGAGIEVLREKGGTGAVGPLVAVLQKNMDCIDHKSEEIIDLFGEIGDARVVEPLVTLLKYKDRFVRAKTARVLGKIGDARAVVGLIACLEDQNREVQNEAAGALKMLHWQPGKDETGARFWIIMQEWAECVKIGADAVKPLIPILKEKNFSKYAAECLGEIGDPSAVEPLILAITYGSYDVDHSSIVEALGKIGDPRAVEPLIAVLKKKAGFYVTNEVRKAATKALGNFKVASAIEAIQEEQERVARVEQGYPRSSSAKCSICGITEEEHKFSLGWCPECGRLFCNKHSIRPDDPDNQGAYCPHDHNGLYFSK